MNEISPCSGLSIQKNADNSVEMSEKIVFVHFYQNRDLNIFENTVEYLIM